MTRDDLQQWLDRYVEAWRTYDPEQISGLFAEDVVYRYHPYDAGDEVLTGRENVVSSWLEPDGNASDRDAAGTYGAKYEAYAVDGNRAVATGWSTYWTDASRTTVQDTYDNVFLIEFADDSRARRFTEYFMKRPRERIESGT